MSEQEFLTRAGYEKLELELKYLRTVRRQEVAQRLHRALEEGDILLPDISCHEVLKELREIPATVETPVIAVSANATESDIEHGSKNGFKAYLTKPLGISELPDTIDNILQCNEA